MPETDPAVAGALANIRDFWHSHVPDEDQDWFHTGVPEAMLNGVRRVSRLDENLWDEVVTALSGAPWRWWVGADSPPGLAEYLLRSGATDLGPLPMLVGDVARFPAFAGVPGLTIREVDDAEIDDWVAVWAAASKLNAANVPAIAQIERGRRWPSDADFVRLAGILDGELVATSMLYARHGIGGIYAVCTEESHRRRGIGRAMTAAAIDAALTRGFQQVALTATPAGYPVYVSMGFREVGGYRLFAPA